MVFEVLRGQRAGNGIDIGKHQLQFVNEAQDDQADDLEKTVVMNFQAMAGVAGILWGILFGSVTEFTGFLPGIKAFSAAVVGGIGNLGGAMAGGLTLGGSESLAPQLILEPLGVTGHTQLKDAVAFLVLIYVLLVKPTGLFGERLSAEDRA